MFQQFRKEFVEKVNDQAFDVRPTNSWALLLRANLH